MDLYQTGGSAKNLQQEKRRNSSCQVGEQVRGYSEELNVPKQFGDTQGWRNSSYLWFSRKLGKGE